jgi:hypothetical protein
MKGGHCFPEENSDEMNHKRVTEKYDVIVLGGGTASKLMAWTMAKERMGANVRSPLTACS